MKWTLLISEEDAREIEDELYYDHNVFCCFDHARKSDKIKCGKIVSVYRNARNDIYGAPAAALVKGSLIGYLRFHFNTRGYADVIRGWPDNVFCERPYV